MKLSRLVVVAACALLAGCGTPPVAGKPPATFAPAELVLRVFTSGGLLPMSAAVTALPEISVYGDGRAITTGATPAIYPGPALPNLQVKRLAPAEVAELARRALAAGVGNGEDTGTPGVMDAPSMRITVRTEAGLVSTVVAAPGFEDDSLSGAQRAARQRMKDLVTDLWVAAGGDQRPAAYEPARIAAVATEWQASGSDLPSDPPAVQWPGDAALPGPALPDRTSVRCVDVAAGPVLAAAKGANMRTPWVSGGSRWLVQFRPLLPDETSCLELNR